MTTTKKINKEEFINAINDKLKKGKWIPKGLKLNDEPIVGWIFSNKRRDAVEQILNA